MIGDIGDNLRDLRAREGMSLRQLANATGLSATLLSQVERGVTDPSLKTLRALSSVFGEASSSLFSNSQPVLLHVSRPGERSRISSPTGHIQYERITPNNGQLEVLRGTLHSGDWSSDTPWSHDAIECVYVEEGVLTVIVGERRLSLETGESVTFESRQPHRYGNETDEITTFILSVTPPTP